MCSATLSDYFDVSKGEINQEKQSRVYVKEAFCEEKLKIDVAEAAKTKQKTQE